MFKIKSYKSHVRSLQLKLIIIFIAIAIFLVIPVIIFLRVAIETSYYDTFKKYIITGQSRWKIPDNIGIKKIMQDLDLNGEQKNVYLFNAIGENKSYTVVDTSKLSDINDPDKMNNVIDSSDSEFEINSYEFIKDVLSSENFIAVNAGKQGYKKKIVRSFKGRTFFDYAFKKKDNIVLYFRYYSEDWNDTLINLNIILIYSCGIAIIISLIIGIFMSKTITGPILSIMNKAQGIAKGNFDQVLTVKSEDEIGKLTQSFNYMANELKYTLNEISSEKNKIETIINYMADGIIAFNIKGEVIHSNPSSIEILGVKEITCSFNEFSSEYDLGVKLEDVIYLDSPGNREKELSINDKYLKVYFATFANEDKRAGGIIVVLHDITEQQKLENMRREFVANVSHELRTPITSIKSYTETLIDGAIEDRETTENFLAVINSEADRMTRLVKDLLQLSRLDNQQMKWNMGRVALVDLVKNSINSLQLSAKNKEIILESFVLGDVPEIEADRDRIEQVVINIINNAIKYTPNGGKITVYMGKLYNEVYFKVTDTGIGIPQKDLPRIFERFYRVDKARSREMGGTGLGLSIAKEIVDAHGGDISITSENNKGTEVVVKLPISQTRESNA